MYLARFVFIGVQVALLDDCGEQVLAVGRIVYGEVGIETEFRGLLSKYAVEYGVECSHPDIARPAVRDDFLDTFAHFSGGLVGEGEGKYRAWRYALLDHVCYAAGKHARFARTCAGHDKRRLVVVEYGLALGGIESICKMRHLLSSCICRPMGTELQRYAKSS